MQSGRLGGLPSPGPTSPPEVHPPPKTHTGVGRYPAGAPWGRGVRRPLRLGVRRDRCPPGWARFVDTGSPATGLDGRGSPSGAQGATGPETNGWTRRWTRRLRNTVGPGGPGPPQGTSPWSTPPVVPPPRNRGSGEMTQEGRSGCPRAGSGVTGVGGRREGNRTLEIPLRPLRLPASPNAPPHPNFPQPRTTGEPGPKMQVPTPGDVGRGGGRLRPCRHGPRGHRRTGR